MRPIILLATLCWSFGAMAQAPTAPGTPSTSPSAPTPAPRVIPTVVPAPPVQPQSAGAKPAEKPVVPDRSKLDKDAQERSQKANDALLERHTAAANRAIRGICAGCMSGAVEDSSSPKRRRAARLVRRGGVDEDYIRVQEDEPVFVSPAPRRQSPRDRWWLTR